MKLEDVKKILKNPKSKSKIEKGSQYQSRLRVLTESLEKNELEKEYGYKHFLKELENVLPSKKYNNVLKYIKTPFEVTALTESMLNELYKVFDASNSFFDYQIESEIKEIDGFVNSLDIPNWVRKNGKSVLKNNPNSIVVLDFDKEKNPYFIIVDNDRVTDVGYNENGDIDYIMFFHSLIEDENGNSQKLYSFYCDEYYRVFSLNDSGEYTLLPGSEKKNSLNYCPAKHFILDYVNENDFYNRKIPFTNYISKLEKWQAFNIFDNQLNYYVPFPIVDRVREKCADPDCVNGFVIKYETYIEDDQKKQRNITTPCKICESKNLIGPGTEIVRSPITSKDDVDNSGSLQLINPEVKNLEYLSKRQNEIESDLWVKIVGNNSVLQNQAINELQVKGSFEGQKTILLRIKPSFDSLAKWMIETACKAKFPRIKIFAVADFGSEFNLFTEDEIQDRFKKAKENGMPESEIDALYTQLIETKYRSNISMIDRQWLIKTIDPCPYDTVAEKIQKLSNRIITDLDFHVSTKITQFINRFEIEQETDIVRFGKSISLNEKIKTIKNTLNTYANEYIKQLPSSSEQVGRSEK